MSFHLHPVGGLCNRLRAMLSYLAAYEDLVVYWDDEVRHFLHMFEPMTGVRFAERPIDGLVDWGIASGAPEDWRKHYASLRPLPHLRKRIDASIAAMSKTYDVGDNSFTARSYIAIHVRRTDMTRLVQQTGASPLPTDDEFAQWIQRWAHELPIWLATDNGETQQRYLTDPRFAYPSGNSRVRFLAPMPGNEVLDDAEHHAFNGPQEDAVVDLYVCAAATEFMGSGSFGTFSGTIEILRGLR